MGVGIVNGTIDCGDDFGIARWVAAIARPHFLLFLLLPSYALHQALSWGLLQPSASRCLASGRRQGSGKGGGRKDREKNQSWACVLLLWKLGVPEGDSLATTS